MKRIAGTTLALIGLALGIAAGFGIVALKKFLVSEIVSALNDEAKKACNCSLEYDTFALSFSTLSGKATNIKLSMDGKQRLAFPLVTSRFSIRHILQKKIALYDLTLTGGYADGVGPDSATFRFIDQLTAPLPPELDKPGRWRVELDSLEIKESALREPFDTSELTGEGVGLFVKRVDENFVLMPSIADLRYRTFTSADHSSYSELPLGKLAASIVIENERAVFNSLTLGDGTSRTTLQATVDTEHDDKMTGDAQLALTTQYIGLPDWLRGSLAGETNVAGTLGSPRFLGTLKNAPQTSVELTFPHASPLAMTSITGSLDVDVRKGDPIVRLSNLKGAGEDGSELRSTEPLLFDDNGLVAGFEVSLPEFTYGPFGIKNGTARISVRPTNGGSETNFDITAGNIDVQKVALGPGTLRIKLLPTSVSTVVDSTHPDQGALHWQGMIRLDGKEPFLEKGTLDLKRFRYPLTLPVQKSSLSPIELTGSLALSGPLDLARLRGEGPIYASFPPLSSDVDVKGQATLKDGTLLVTADGVSNPSAVELKLDLVKTASGKLKVKLPLTDISRLFVDTTCGGLEGNFDYSFAMSEPLGGSGALLLNTFELGCAPYTIHLPKNLNLPISQGSLRFKSVILSGFNTALTLNGEAGFSRGFDMTLAGDLYLSALLPLLPSIDDLQGRLQTNVSLKGSLGAPLLGGSAKLTKGQLGLDSPDIEAHDVSGSFLLRGKTIAVNDLAGSLNNGRFVISGDLVPFDWPHSSLKATLHEVTIAPVEDTSITFSGALTLGLNELKHQALRGELSIELAEISKDLDMNKIIVQAIAGYFLPTRIKPQVGSEMVDLDLDVHITAPRNIFVLTPFFSAELNADVRAQGTTRQPALNGSMQILGGWVGLKGNRFDITNGAVLFKPGSLTPSVELASEGTLRTPNGDSILVILEASGPLKNPRITLSSDRGLSQEELLLLLTSSRTLAGRTLANRAGMQFRDDQRFFFSRDSFSSFTAFFRNLTRIDTLSFEPMYNQFTGSIEPALVARKDLSNRLSLVGESLFSTVSSSRAGVVYSISPDLSINAFSQTISTQQNAIASSDLTYTILSEQAEFVSLHVVGTEEVSEDELLSAARIGRTSRIKNNAESLATIQRDMLNYLRDQGLLAADVEVTCSRVGEYCDELNIRVREGTPSIIKDVITQSPPLPEKVTKRIPQTAKVGSRATGDLVKEIERTLVIALRNEGYIAARVIPRYGQPDEDSKTTLTISIEPGQPISFVFHGNTVFSAGEFLDSIDLFSRKRPFGNNTIKLLVQNIEAMYHEKGYLFVQVTYSEDRSDPSRLVYSVRINEEAPTKVVDLRLLGNESLSLKRIKVVMKELGYANQAELLHPDYAIPSQLETLRDILSEVYQQEGFPNASVTYQITQEDSASDLVVQFTIEEGEPVLIGAVSLQGAPENVTLPNQPALPTSLARINAYIAQLMEALRSAGYLYPTVTASPGDAPSSLDIELLPGELTTIESVAVDGLSRITEEVARRYISLAADSPYRAEDVNQTKRELLRSGLFSRVEIVARDGAFDSAREELIVRVAERPLNTLEVGTGANSEFGLHLFGEAVDKSLFADGRTLSTRVDTYLDQAHINASGSDNISQGFANIRYLDPSFLESPYSLNEEVRFQRQQLSTQEFDQDRLLFASYLFRQYSSGATVSAGHSLMFDNLFNVSPDAIISELDDGSVRLSFLSAIAKLDRRDDPLLPQSGYTITLEPKLSLVALGSQADFASIRGRATKIIPLETLSPRWTVGLGLMGGISQGFGPTDEIPITQRFYLGGRTTVRGFRENSLGPRGDEGSVIGGDTLLGGKSELQYLVADSFSTHVFLDAGNVFLRERSFSLGDIRTSTGVGFQYLSPIGPIGFDVGHPLDEKSGEPSVRVHFSVGSAF
jgi:outer membrane protein insertion porin family